MTELIHITTDAQGASVVSARELHYFLEVKTPLEKWIPRMAEYGFVEGVDYQQIDKVVSTGNGAKRTALDDYALTLDMAKELSMIQRSDKGKEARQYFIDCERIAKAQAAFPPADFTQVLTILAQQNQLLMQYNERFLAMESKVSQIANDTPALPEPGVGMHRNSYLRKRILDTITLIAGASNKTGEQVWRGIWERFFNLYNIQIEDYRHSWESSFSAAERLDLLDKVYAVILTFTRKGI